MSSKVVKNKILILNNSPLWMTDNHIGCRPKANVKIYSEVIEISCSGQPSQFLRDVG